MVAVETGDGVVLLLGLRQESTRVDNQVADVELASLRDNKKSITAAFKTSLRMVFAAGEERSKLLIGTGVTDDDEPGGLPLAIDNRERRMATVVLEHE